MHSPGPFDGVTNAQLLAPFPDCDTHLVRVRVSAEQYAILISLSPYSADDIFLTWDDTSVPFWRVNIYVKVSAQRRVSI